MGGQRLSTERVNAADLVILISNFSVPTGLRVAEAAISNQQAWYFSDSVPI